MLMFYTIKTNKGYIPYDFLNNFTDDIGEAIKFKYLDVAVKSKNDIIDSLEPKVYRVDYSLKEVK